MEETCINDIKKLDIITQRVSKFEKQKVLEPQRNEENILLCMRIRSVILNTKKALKFTKYDGTTNPCLYLCIFDEVSLITMDSDLHANLFPMSLTGDVIDWFGELPHASIDNFEQLKSVFYNLYQIQISKKVTFSNLMKIKKKEG